MFDRHGREMEYLPILIPSNVQHPGTMAFFVDLHIKSGQYRDHLMTIDDLGIPGPFRDWKMC